MVARRRRRGEGAANSAAILVALIGVLLVIYILALPPEDRNRLLNGGGAECTGQGCAQGGGGSGPVLILAETPGTLQLQASPQVEHKLPSTTVFTVTETAAIKEVAGLYLKNSLFSKEGASVSFEASPRSSGNYLLSFNVDYAGGSLSILLNGEQIYNGVIAEPSPQPIELPYDLLEEGKNEIVFLVGDVGFAFWKKNEYRLRNVLISADVTDFSGSQSEQHFSLGEQEYSQLEHAQLELVPDCDPRKAGRLVIEANKKLLYNGYPDCGVMNRLDISKETLRAGDNAIVFVSDTGSYLLDRIQVVSYLKEQEYPLYYFNLPLEMYEPIDEGANELILTMRFADYRAEKRGEIIINGFVQSFSSKDYVFQAVIDPGIVMPGPNTVQIIPHVNKLDVAELKIELV